MGGDAERGMVTVRMFGVLREVRRGQGLPPTADVEVPAQGSLPRGSHRTSVCRPPASRASSATTRSTR